MIYRRRAGEFSPKGFASRFKVMVWLQHAIVFAASTLFCLATLSSNGAATIVATVADPDMAQDAVAIVTGRVMAIESNWDPHQQQIFTHITLSLDEVLKGEILDAQLTIKQTGGVIGNAYSWVQGSPEFLLGEKALLFLTQNEDGSLRVAHLYQGKFSILVDSFTLEEFAFQATPAGVHVMSQTGRPDDLNYRLHRLADLKRGIRSAARAGGRRPSKPIVGSPHVASAVTQSNEEFTLLGNARWFEPDDGLPVLMRTNQQGEVAAPTGGFTQVGQALAAWTNVSGSSFKYQDGGTTTEAGFRLDGVNAISFRDPLRQMDNPVRCGGILAQGGFFSIGSQTRVVSGQRFSRIVEGDVVVNDGWQGCGFYEDFENLAEVLAHELGHVLGLDHSPDPNALMAPYAHFDGRGATLGPDDLAGVRFIYPAAAQTPAVSLQASLSASPTSLKVGKIITVKMTVINQGSQSVVVTPSTLTVQGSGAVSLRSSPSAATVGPGQSKNFSWSYAARGPGEVRFVGSATAPQGSSSLATSNPVTIR
jgi:hypothetical protein